MALKRDSSPAPAATLVGRRDLLSTCSLGALALAGASGMGVGLAALWPRAGVDAGGRVDAGLPDQYKVGTADGRFLALARFWIVRTETGLFAASARCTHLGCKLRHDAAGGGFQCMCHGSTFDAGGELLRGPAPRGMDRFGVVIGEDGRMVVDTSRRLRREAEGSFFKYKIQNGS